MTLLGMDVGSLFLEKSILFLLLRPILGNTATKNLYDGTDAKYYTGTIRGNAKRKGRKEKACSFSFGLLAIDTPSLSGFHLKALIDKTENYTRDFVLYLVIIKLEAFKNPNKISL